MNGEELLDFAKSIFPFNRSITGDGLRRTLEAIRGVLPELEIRAVPSGTQCFDWIVPDEWSVNEAYVIDPHGNRVIDFAANNLHLVNYSDGFVGDVSLDELQAHLHSLPDQPTAIPYVTSYYSNAWGFCISENERRKLVEGNYRVVIDSRKFPGELNFGEILIPGELNEEIFLTTYVCHPSMANNEVSGPTVLAHLGKWLSNRNNRFSYRIVFAPETIGAIAYLRKNFTHLQKHVKAAFNLTCIGDERAYSYISTRSENTLSDRVVRHVANQLPGDCRRFSFQDRGSDERQYGSPLVNLPMVTLCRTRFYDYPEYHTSLDDFSVVTAEGLKGGFNFASQCVQTLEINKTYVAQFPCEPQLGRHGLYPLTGGRPTGGDTNLMLDVLAYSDGDADLLEIAEILSCPLDHVAKAANTLANANLLRHLDK